MADNVKKLYTRIALKYDSYAAWTTAPGKDLVLLAGELGICHIGDVDQGSNVVPTVLFKVGDGASTFEQLPWASAKAADVYTWAKASDVVYSKENKTITFVNGAVDAEGKKIDKVFTLNYVTEAEVKAITDTLDSRITAIESSIGAGGTVASDIADLKERMGDAEQDITDLGNNKLDKNTYETYIAGKEMSDAALKEYADGKASEAQTAAETTAANALTTAVGTLEAADSALGGRIDGVSTRVAALEGTEGAIATGDAATLASAKSYADGKASDAQTAAQGHADSVAATAKSEAIAAAKSETESQISTLNGTLSAKDSELEGKIGANTTAIADEKSARETAINTINGKLDVDKVSTAIATAKQEAIDAAATTAQGKVDALAVTVGENTTNIGANSAAISAMDTAYKKAVQDEAKERGDKDAELEGRLEEVEAFFHTAEGETLDGALDTLKEIQDYLKGEEGAATGGIISRVAANEDAIDGLNSEFAEGGRVTVAENAIDALEAKDASLEATIDTKLAAETFNTWKGTHETDHAKTATEITTEITTAVNGEKSAREAADAAIEEKIGGSYSKESTVAAAIDAVSTVANRADAKSVANAGRLDTVEGKVSDLETASAKHAEQTYVDEKLADKVNVSDYNNDKAATEQALANVYTKGEADSKFALASVVSENTTNIGKNTSDIAKVAGDLASEVTNRGTAITEATNTITAAYEAADLAINNKIGGSFDAENTVAKAISDAQAAAEGKVTELANGQVKTNKEDIAQNAADISAVSGRVSAIEERFPDWFIIDCGSATTVIDETK